MEIAYRLTQPIALSVQLHVRGLTVLLGASGAGKTSLLRAIAGLLPADGSPFHGIPVQKRPVGYLPQHYALFPHLSALGNVCFSIRHLPHEQRTRKAMQLLESLGVSHCAQRKPAALSGGEQQRVALARALAREPEILLLDEPLSAIDSPTARDILGWLSRTVAELGIPVLAATHDPLLAAAADRIAILHGGRIVQQGGRDAIMSAPEGVAAARLLGYTNFVGFADANLVGYQTGGVEYAGTDFLAFRPERAWVVTPGAACPEPGGLAVRVRCTVDSVSRPYASVNVRGYALSALLAPDLLSSGAERGSELELLVPEQAVRVLPAESA
ncbi:MAG TPA: ATP-binding cassette domain-containing protein [Gemmatimonadales bacterium]|nr:ATP-binding cassette domain-containing protein [Gemmatimonadales bacterium]